jgi:hypothetical protein
MSNPAAYPIPSPIPVAQEQPQLPMVQTIAPTATNYPPIGNSIGAINATHVTNIGCYIVPK